MAPQAPYTKSQRVVWMGWSGRRAELGRPDPLVKADGRETGQPGPLFMRTAGTGRTMGRSIRPGPLPHLGEGDPVAFLQTCVRTS